MFYNQNQNRPNVNVNSNLLSLYSDDARVSISGWNRGVSVDIAKCIGQKDGLREYGTIENGQAIKTSLSQDNVVSLLECGIELKKNIEDKTPKSYSTKIISRDGRVKIFTIGYDGENTYLEIAGNINEDGSVDPENRLHYTFNTRVIEEDYDFTTGSSIPRHVESEYERFLKTLDMAKFFGPEVNHGVRYDNAVRAAFSNNRNVGRQNNYGNGGRNYTGGYGNQNAFLPVSDVSDEELPFN